MTACPKRRTSVNSRLRPSSSSKPRPHVARLRRRLVEAGARPGDPLFIRSAVFRCPGPAAAGCRSSAGAWPASGRPRGRAAGTCRAGATAVTSRPAHRSLERDRAAPGRVSRSSRTVQRRLIRFRPAPARAGGGPSPPRETRASDPMLAAEEQMRPWVGLEVGLLQLLAARGGCRAGWSRGRRGRASPGPSAGRSRRRAGGWRRSGAGCAGSSGPPSPAASACRRTIL